jgi:hypothetical protein
MREFIEDVPMSFYGLDEALQLLTNRILEREPALSWPESMPPFPESRGVVATFAARAWVALYGACERIKAAIALDEFELCYVDFRSGRLMRIQSSDVVCAAFFDEIVRGGVIRACAGEALEWLDGRRVLTPAKDCDRWLRKQKLREVARQLFFRWLERQMSDGPKEKTKADYRKEAIQKFNVSARLFDKEWQDCLAKTGAGWDRAGRPRKNHPQKIKANFS